jgi:hypothetical protein
MTETIGLPDDLKDPKTIIELRRINTSIVLRHPHSGNMAGRLTVDHYKDSGWLLYVPPLVGKFDIRLETFLFDLEHKTFTYNVQLATPAEKREKLKRNVYEKCKKLLSDAVEEYSPAEMSQWAGMVTAAKAASWSFFDAMATPGLNGQEYGEVVLQKNTSLKLYFDGCLSARNTHKVNIDNTQDALLDDYDIASLWPQEVI